MYTGEWKTKEMLMSVAPSAPGKRGRDSSRTMSWVCPPVLHRREVGNLAHTLQRLLAGHMWTHSALGNVALRPSPLPT